jgi:hypothetical protein
VTQINDKGFYMKNILGQVIALTIIAVGVLFYNIILATGIARK